VSQPSGPDGGGWSSPNYGGARRARAGDAGGWPQSSDTEDGWGPSTAVRPTGPGGPAEQGAYDRVETPRRAGRTRPDVDPRDRDHDEYAPARRSDSDPWGADASGEAEWSPAGPVSAREQRATRAAEQREAKRTAAEARRTERGIQQLQDRTAPKVHERGLPWWGALIVLVVIAAIGGVIDTVGSISVQGGFNVGIVVASIVAIIVVKRSHMFPVVIAPPIVYSLASVFQLYLRSDGLSDHKKIFDAAANYLVYGFPAIAAATAAVLIIAGIRLIARK
jgi:hypothetical protein